MGGNDSFGNATLYKDDTRHQKSSKPVPTPPPNLHNSIELIHMKFKFGVEMNRYIFLGVKITENNFQFFFNFFPNFSIKSVLIWAAIFSAIFYWSSPLHFFLIYSWKFIFSAFFSVLFGKFRINDEEMIGDEFLQFSQRQWIARNCSFA